MGKLVLYYATMNSGKSLDLIRTDFNYKENGFKTIVMKPSVDTKGEKYIETRAGGLKRKVDFLIGEDDRIIDILKNNLNDIECIFIDEAQFLTEKQIKELRIISSSTNLAVICYALRLNFRGEMFEGSKALFTDADKIIELKTLCKCKKTARYVGRKVNGEFVYEGEEIVIDGENDLVEYIPLCDTCFMEQVQKKDLSLVRKKLYE